MTRVRINSLDTAGRDANTPLSRRLACRAAAGGAIGALMIRFGLVDEAAAAKCKKIRVRCTSKSQCCKNPNGPGGMLCQVNGRDQGRRCCVPDGGKCQTGSESDAQCCGVASLCNGGFCDRNN